VKLDGRADRIEALAAALAAAEDKGTQLTAALEATGSQHAARVTGLEASVAALQAHSKPAPTFADAVTSSRKQFNIHLVHNDVRRRLLLSWGKLSAVVCRLWQVAYC
jgi:hypothetical protein